MDFGHFIFMGYEIWTFHTSVSVQYMTSCCLACFFFMFIHVVACINTFCIYQVFFIQSPIDRHLDCFYLLAIVDNAAVNIRVQVFFLSSNEGPAQPKTK